MEFEARSRVWGGGGGGVAMKGVVLQYACGFKGSAEGLGFKVEFRFRV